MRSILWKWAKATLLSTVLIAALLGALWLCAYVMPSLLAVRLGMAATGIAMGLAQAALISGLSRPNDLLRTLNRVLFIAAWLAVSQSAIGPFLDMSAGGNARASMQTSLSALRGAVAAYHNEHRGEFPARFEGLVVSGQTVRIPPTWRGSSGFAARLLPHGPTTGVEYYGNEICHGATNLHPVRELLRDTGRWGYVADPKSPCWGMVFIDCSHPDFKGGHWADY
jgi:F0F1-type ATP synthase membrane subunit c/vacuolar-type H+-ATPase subunit K